MFNILSHQKKRPVLISHLTPVEWVSSRIQTTNVAKDVGIKKAIVTAYENIDAATVDISLNISQKKIELLYDTALGYIFKEL